MAKVANLFSPVTGPAEVFIRTQPIIFSLIILYQGLFSGNAFKVPDRLMTLFENKAFRFTSLMLIAFSATKDIEYALFSTLIFLSIMYAFKTPEEREKTGFI
ncbi:hypothetical protein OAE98_03295 [Akkermansiaceae bacterium]|jgi:hypothetical protein|nr:hypothetical protein [Akkermansiaceae bacterium]